MPFPLGKPFLKKIFEQFQRLSFTPGNGE